MTDESPVQIVRLTPPGRAAIASIGVRGVRGVEFVDQCFRPASGRSLATARLGQIVFGRWLAAATDEKGEANGTGEPAGEEVVVARISETNIEIHCHGGTAAVAAIVANLCAAAAKEIDWREGGVSDDPIREAARVAMAEARTERTAAILLDQYQGALRRELESAIVEIQRGDTKTADARLETLLAKARLGLHLVRPWQIVLAGPPNVGKSTLINAIVGYRRAITYAQPGTTRDVVTATAAIDGWPVELSDTAGLRATGDAIEAAGVTRAEEKLAAADLALLVFDRSQPWTDEHERLVGRWPNAVLVHNKADLAEAADGRRPVGLTTSAQSGVGVDELLSQVANHLNAGKLVPGEALPFTGEQVTAIRKAWGQISADGAEAISHLKQLMTTPHLTDYP